jgi:DNA-binding SARP family transcriptional activator
VEVLRLHTFGSAFVARATGEPIGGAASQRRTVALLALLSVAGDAGMSRDKLVGLLWPDVDSERARHSLTQALYNARKALGADDLFVAEADVRLNQGRLTSDVREFGAAIDAGDLKHAVALYRGSFLDGFFVSGAAELERWISSQRERFEARVSDALHSLATSAEGAGDHRSAVEWRRRAAELFPLDSGGALKLMTAMVRAGDRASALQHAQIHATLLRQELGIDPDPAVQELAAQLRETTGWELPNADSGRRPSSPPSGMIANNPVSVESGNVVAGDVSGEPLRSHLAHARPMNTGPVAVARLSRPPRRSRAVRAGLLIAVAGALIGTGIAFERARKPSARPAPQLTLRQRVVVAPFRVGGTAPGLEYLQDGIVELLSTRLADDTSARSVDAGGVLAAWRASGLAGPALVPRDTIVRLAARLGAERVVMGSVVGTPAQLVITASVSLVPSGVARGEATVSGPVDSITTLVDRLAARLLIADANEGESLAHYTSASLPALRAFLDGQAAFRRSDFLAALQRYDTALRRDSTFALAALYRALAADELNDEPELRASVAVAWNSSSALSDRDRSLLTALVGDRYPSLPTTTDLDVAWQRVVDLAPGSAEAWSFLGARLLHDGAAAGTAVPTRRAVNAYQRAISLNPGFVSAWRALAQLGELPPESALMSIPVDAPRAQREAGVRVTPFVRWRIAALSADTLTLEQLRDTLPTLGPVTLRAIARASQFDAIVLEDGARALEVLRPRSGRPADAAILALAEHSLAVNRGRPLEALAATSRLRRALPGSHAWLRLRVLDALYADGDVAAAEAAARQLAEFTDGGPASPSNGTDAWFADACVLAQWRLARGDTTQVQEIITRLDSARSPATSAAFVSASPNACAVLLEVAYAVVNGSADAGQRIRTLDSLVFTPQVAGDAVAYAPLLIARLHERRGGRELALRAVRRRIYLSGWPRYMANAWLHEGKLAMQLGDTVGATDAYRKFLAVRDSPDDSLAPQVDSVRRLLAPRTRRTDD